MVQTTELLNDSQTQAATPSVRPVSPGDGAQLGTVVKAADVAAPFRSWVRKTIESELNGEGPRLVAFLASDDAGARKYAAWTHNACVHDGLNYELREVAKDEIEEALEEANSDPSVHGILVYYPMFGSVPSYFGNTMDQYLRDSVSIEKDVEGLCYTYRWNLYRNKRYLDPPTNQIKSIVPCTPLAIVKILEYLHVYDESKTFGNRLEGKVLTVINRSEIVGHPLSAMLANDGACVYSIDIDSVFRVVRGKLTKSDDDVESACSRSDVIITGVPVKDYRLNTEFISPNTVVINFSHFKNVDKDKLLCIPGVRYVPNVGKVTVAMLERNCVRLRQMYGGHSNREAEQTIIDGAPAVAQSPPISS